MTWEETITKVGFPIAMCIWFMVRTEKVIKNNTEALIKFKDVIKWCKK